MKIILIHYYLIVEYNLYSDEGVLDFCYKRIKNRGRMVIVIAEGACNFTLKISKAFRDLKIGAEGKDASGNVKYSDVGSFFAKELSKYCKE